MNFSIRFADKIVGTLIILALAILVFVIFMLGRNQRWFVRDYQYKTYFPSGAGISRNMAIQYRGFTIGHVKDLRLADDDSVEVIFTIFEEYSDRVREGSVVEIQISPIGLGSSFIFYPGRGSEIIPEGMVIPEINSLQARQLLAAGLTNRYETSDSISNIMNQVRTVLETVNVALAGSDSSEDSALSQIINNIESVTADISSLARNINYQINPILNDIGTLSNQLADPSGTVMSILDGEGPVYTNLVDAIDSLAGIIRNLEKTSEFIPTQLPQIAVFITDLNIALRTLQDVLTAAANNPLLRGGVPQRTETSPGGTNPRNLDF